MKIKTFQFYVTDNSTIDRIRVSMGLRTTWPVRDIVPIASPTDIDKEINKFIKGKSVVDIKINNVTVHRHNNGGDDTNISIYTIMYND